MPASLAAPRNLSHLLRLAAVGGASLLAATLLAVVWQLAARFDAAARTNMQQIVAAGVQSMRDANKLVVRDYARWSAAYQAVRAADLDWLARNLGAGASDEGVMDAVVLVGPGLPDGLAWAAQDLGVDASDLAALTVSAEALARQRGLDPYDLPTGGFLPIDGRVWMVAIDWVLPQNPEEADDPRLALMVAAQLIDTADIAALGERLLVDGLTLGADAAVGHDSLPLTGPEGTVAHVLWPLPQPGRAALASFAMPLGLVLALTVAAVGAGTLAASRLAERLERALVAAQAADRTKAEFIATLSHELRTPMNGIVGMLDVLASTDLDADQAECVRVALDSAETQLDMIDRLLRFGQLEAGQAALSIAPFSPAALLDEVVALLRPTAEAKGLTLAASRKGPVGAMLLGDRLAIRQIAINLIGNAIKFTDVGAVRVHLAAAAGLGVQRLSLSVSDSGPGVAPADRARIFESFVQGDSSAERRHAGVGLGLTISHRLARAMGGTLRLEPVGPPGATFVFETALDLAVPGRPRLEDAA